MWSTEPFSSATVPSQVNEGADGSEYGKRTRKLQGLVEVIEVIL